jgi:hypothetical protein
LLNAALGVSGAALSPHAAVHTAHNPTTNRLLIFISWKLLDDRYVMTSEEDRSQNCSLKRSN